ncbi:MAG: CBS domain-containing protein [Ectothiorhodospiraceae bacterium]|nr:CBS domain-containing protein [Ectothiorhodospiraceae bacterium]MCH8505228.1 CBS domain-containing protein [Ectothiorhodospiraceae bacterium]
METPLHVVLTQKAELMPGTGGTLYTVRPHTRASEAIRVMTDGNIGCVLVIDDGKLAGIFSERDVLRRIADRGLSPDAVSVKDVMSTKLYTVPPSMTVEDALVECTDRRIRHLPVVDGKRLMGLLSIGDLVRFVVQDKDRDIADLMDYIHGHQIEV